MNKKISWSKTADYIEKEIMSLEKGKSAYCFWVTGKKKVKIKLLKVRVFEKDTSKSYPIGKTLVAPQNELCVQCKKGFLIVEKLQMEKEKPMASEKFIRSHPKFIGTILK